MSFVKSSSCSDTAGSNKGYVFLRLKVTQWHGSWEDKSVWLQVATDGDLDHQQTEEEEMAFVEANKLSSRPTSCDLGLFAICTFFFKKRETSGTFIINSIPRAAQGTGIHAWQPLAACSSCLTRIKSPLESLFPGTWSLPLFLCSVLLGPNKDIFSIIGMCQLMTQRAFLVAANGHVALWLQDAVALLFTGHLFWVLTLWHRVPPPMGFLLLDVTEVQKTNQSFLRKQALEP